MCYYNTMIRIRGGFTLVEILVALTIISILLTAIFVNFNDSRAQARDNARQSELKALQLALETFRAENGRYPESCGTDEDVYYRPTDCVNFIALLVPDFIRSLPTEAGFGYRVGEEGDWYQLIYEGVERLFVDSASHPFACPAGTIVPPCVSVGGAPPADVYALYSPGAENK